MQGEPLVVALELEGVVEVDVGAVEGLGDTHERTDGEPDEGEVQLPLDRREIGPGHPVDVDLPAGPTHDEGGLRSRPVDLPHRVR